MGRTRRHNVASAEWHICGNCGKRWDFHELRPVKDGYERMSDEDMPHVGGECPECGALCWRDYRGGELPETCFGYLPTDPEAVVVVRRGQRGYKETGFKGGRKAAIEFNEHYGITVDQMEKMVAHAMGVSLNPPPDEDLDGGIGDAETNPHPLESGVATRLWQDDSGNVHLSYHDIDVVSFDNEWITLRTGGWDTVTMRKRMNDASDHFGLGFRVYRDRGTTWVDYGGSRFELLDPTSMSRFRPSMVKNADVVEPTSDMPTGRRAPGWAERIDAGALPSSPEAREEHLRRAGYVTFTRRTNFPKLGYIIHRLNELNIPSVLHGESSHADHILWVPESRHNEAYAILDDDWGGVRLDDIEDDDPSFEEYALVRPTVGDIRFVEPLRPTRPSRARRRPVQAHLPAASRRRDAELGFEEGEWEETEKNPPPEGTDVLVHEHGQVSVFLPLTGGSRDWWSINAKNIRKRGGVYLVDGADSRQLVKGMQEAGLRVFVR